MGTIQTAGRFAPAAIAGDIRRRILSDPELILGDRDIMRALVEGAETEMGNVVDLRGMAMARLEERLDRLEETHRSVISAAYENLAGTNQIHRAVTRLLDAGDFGAFLADLRGRVAETLRVESVVLVMETEAPDPIPASLRDVLRFAAPGFIQGYVSRGRPAPTRQVTLRQLRDGDDGVHGAADGDGEWIASEACIVLDLGAGRLPAMLAMGCEDPHQFKPGQGTDLLAFFGGVAERVLRRWID